MGLFKKKFDFQVLSTTMMGAVSDIFEKMCSEKFTQPPDVKVQPIWIENDNPERMSASGFEKHIGRCYISVIYMYLSPAHMEKNKPCGTVILYAKHSCAARLLKALQMATDEKLDEKDIKDMLGEFCNMIVGAFKANLAGIGFADLTISSPANFLDKVPEGVHYDYAQEEYQEFRFSLWQETAFVVDVTLSPIPKSR